MSKPVGYDGKLYPNKLYFQSYTSCSVKLREFFANSSYRFIDFLCFDFKSSKKVGWQYNSLQNHFRQSNLVFLFQAKLEISKISIFKIFFTRL